MYGLLAYPEKVSTSNLLIRSGSVGQRGGIFLYLVLVIAGEGHLVKSNPGGAQWAGSL